MKMQQVDSMDVECINRLLKKGFRMFRADKRCDGKVMLVFVKE